MMSTSPRCHCLAAIVLVLCVGRSTAAEPNDAVRWNAVLLEAVRTTAFPPMHAARAFAIVHTCMYDAWAAYDDVALATRTGGRLRRPAGERTGVNRRKAVSYAAYRSLVDLFPSERRLFDVEMARLGYDPRDVSSVPADVGVQTCDAVLEFRHADGANQLGDMNGGGAYSDYTGYLPVNDVDRLSDPIRWQPLPPVTYKMQALLAARWTTIDAPQVFLAPHWGRVTPFALTSANQFDPGPPPSFGTIRYAQQALEVVAHIAALSDARKAIALYWADGPNSETPPGHWSLFAQFVSRRDQHTFDQDIKMFFVLGNAMLDTSIAVWDCKRQFDYVRPVTAVRVLYAGQFVDAWAGLGNGVQRISGETFRSYIPTPPFSEYPSGHSAFSAASAEILRLVTGSDAFGASYTVRAGSSFVEPGAAPSMSITLTWATLGEAADQAGLSRQYAGLHFSDSDLASRTMGRKIATVVWEKAQTYFTGAVAPLTSTIRPAERSGR
jgi:hypothetical protein